MAAADKHTVIGAETRVSGEVRGEESLVVKGRIDGRVSLTETLFVEAGAIVQADVEVKTLVVDGGVVVGTIRATESVRLADKSKVIGDIFAPRIAIESGAAYRGRVEMGEAGAQPRAERQAATTRETSERAPAKAPPRMAPPPRTTATTPSAPAAPPRIAPPAAQVASASGLRPPVAPPRAAAPAAAATAGAANGSGPAWARKKVRRR